MPNWCSNSLHFEGNPQRIAEVAEQILIKTDDGYQFSFQHIVPMPEELILPEVPDSYMQLTWLQIAQQPEKKLINLEQEMLEQSDKSSWSVQYRLPDELFSELKQYFSEKFDWNNLTVGEVFTHFEDNAEVASRFRYDQQFAKRIAENIRQYGHQDWYDWRLANWGCKWDVDPDCTFVTVEESDIWISCDTAWGPPDRLYKEIAKRFPDLVFEAKYLEEGMWFAGSYEGHEGVLFDYPCEEDEVRAFAIEHFGCEYDEDEDSE